MAKKIRNVWDYNFAAIPEVRERILKYFVPRLKSVRDQRKTLELDWKKFFNMWNVTHDEHHSYMGRAKLYIPEVRKNVEAQARQLTEAAFPREDFFDVSPGASGTKKGAAIQKSIRRWQIENAKLRPKYHVFARQEALYGPSPVMIPWNRKVEHIFRSAKDRKTGKIKPTRQMVEIFNGPDFVVKDVFKWYSLNPFKEDLLEDGCFEYLTENRHDLIRKEKAGELWGLKELLERKGSDATKMEELQEDIDRAEAIGLEFGKDGYAGEATLSADEDDEDNGTHLVALIFTSIELPEAIDEQADEDPRLPIPVMIKIYDDAHVGLVRRNPFFHQRPPYLLGKYILPNANGGYPQGLVHAIQYMQHEINSKIEQAMDSATLALNPIAFIDPALAAQIGDFSVEPGATWFVSPAGVKFGQIPDVTPTAYAAVAQLRSQIADFSDRSPALPPQLLGKSRTATQSELVFETLSTDNKAFQLQNETLVLEPMMEMWESLTDQNITEDQVIMILGRRATDWKRALISKSDILGSYRYFWKASSNLQNKTILSRQIIDAIKVYSALPPEDKAKLKLNLAEVYKMLWTEGFGLPDADKVFGEAEEMHTQDAEVEHKMLRLGMEIEVLPGDNDRKHLEDHDKFLAQTKDAAIKADLIAHMQHHRAQLEAKVEAVKQLQMQQQMLIAAAAAQQGGKGKQGNSSGSGNRTQLSPNASVGDMGSGVRA